MTMRRAPGSPRGQILLIVAFGLVVLMGIAALVVDLGFSWMLRRQEQNAADPAAVAAARWLKDEFGNSQNPFPNAYFEACFYAKQNGFFASDTADCATARAVGDLEVNSPPVGGPYSGQRGKVQVVIRATHPSFFARIFGQSSATVTTSAVAANDDDDANSSSLVALKEICEGGSAGTVTGGGTVQIFPATPGAPGGYVHVNSPCGTATTDDLCLGGSGAKALDVSGGGTLISPFAYTVGSCAVNGSSTNADPNGLWCDDTFTDNTCLDENAVPLADPLAGMPRPELDSFPAPPCPDAAEPNNPTSTGCTLNQSTCPVDAVTGGHVCTLQPGVYYGGWFVKQNVTVELRPGLYYLAGGGIRVTNNSVIESVESDTGVEARVTIFSTDGPGCPSIAAQCQGAITFVATAQFKAKATNTASCQAILTAGGPNICPWRGVLLWQDGNVLTPGKAITLGGQSSSILSGTIYAPLSDVSINGGQDTTGCTGLADQLSCLAIQIISYTWKIDGNALVQMPYDPSELYQFPQRGLIH